MNHIKKWVISLIIILMVTLISGVLYYMFIYDNETPHINITCFNYRRTQVPITLSIIEDNTGRSIYSNNSMVNPGKTLLYGETRTTIIVYLINVTVNKTWADSLTVHVGDINLHLIINLDRPPQFGLLEV